MARQSDKQDQKPNKQAKQPDEQAQQPNPGPIVQPDIHLAIKARHPAILIRLPFT